MPEIWRCGHDLPVRGCLIDNLEEDSRQRSCAAVLDRRRNHLQHLSPSSVFNRATPIRLHVNSLEDAWPIRLGKLAAKRAAAFHLNARSPPASTLFRFLRGRQENLREIANREASRIARFPVAKRRSSA